MSANKRQRIFTWSFIMVFIAAGMIRVSYQMQNTLMPLYMGLLGYSASSIGMTTTVCTIASLILRPLLGGMLDRYGRRVLALVGTALFAVATLLCGFFGGFAVLLALRALQGFGFSSHTTAINTMATDILPEDRMSEGIGYMGLTGSLSSAIAPAVALLFVSSGNYKLGFIMAGLAGVVAVASVLLVRAPDVKAQNQREKMSLFDRLWEKSALKPTLIMLILGACAAAGGTFLPTFALGKGFNSAQISLYFTVNAVATVLARLFGARASRKLGMKATLVVATALSVGGYLILAFSPNVFGLWAAAAMQGLSYGTLYPMMNAMAVTGASPDRRGVAMATFLTGMDIGMGFGASFWGLIIDWLGIEYMFPMCAAIALVIYFACRLLLPCDEAPPARA